MSVPMSYKRVRKGLLKREISQTLLSFCLNTDVMHEVEAMGGVGQKKPEKFL